MQRDIQFDIAEFISDQGFSGPLVLVVPHTLAQRLVNGSTVVNSDMQSAEDVMYMEATEWDGLEIRYELGSLPDDQVIVRQGGNEYPLTLLPTL